MFTGIVETTARAIERTKRGLIVERPSTFDDITIGASIAINGTCLSVVKFDDQSMSFDVVQETWDRTNLGSLTPGDPVNLERSVAATGRFEGHMVQGHIEGTATITNIEQGENWTTLTLDLPKELMPYIVAKGCIAVDGISLTVVDVNNHTCTIALIPHTLEITTMGSRKVGERVNIETDVLGRYVLQYLAAHNERT